MFHACVIHIHTSAGGERRLQVCCLLIRNFCPELHFKGLSRCFLTQLLCTPLYNYEIFKKDKKSKTMSCRFITLSLGFEVGVETNASYCNASSRALELCFVWSFSTRVSLVMNSSVIFFLWFLFQLVSVTRVASKIRSGIS